MRALYRLGSAAAHSAWPKTGNPALEVLLRGVQRSAERRVAARAELVCGPSHRSWSARTDGTLSMQRTDRGRRVGRDRHPQLRRVQRVVAGAAAARLGAAAGLRELHQTEVGVAGGVDDLAEHALGGVDLPRRIGESISLAVPVNPQLLACRAGRSSSPEVSNTTRKYGLTCRFCALTGAAAAATPSAQASMKNRTHGRSPCPWFAPTRLEIRIGDSARGA